MKVVHTYVDKIGIIWKELLYTQYLSAILAKKHYGNITFYGDVEECRQVIDLGLPYDEVNDKIVKRVDSNTWSIPKLKVYESMNESFLHIDTDTLLFNKIIFDTYDQNYLFSHIDMHTPSDLSKNELISELYKYYSNPPYKNPENIKNKNNYFYINKTYSKLFFDLIFSKENGSTLFDSYGSFETIPNMNIVYIKDHKSFSKVCRDTINHYIKHSGNIDNEEYGSCYIEQLMLHTNLRISDKKYRKSSDKNNHVIFNDIPTIQVDAHNNVPNINDVKFPFRLHNIKGKHFNYGDGEVITKLSKIKNYSKLTKKKKIDKITIKDRENILDFLNQEFNGFFHVTYMKWYDIMQVYVIHRLRMEVGDDKIREIHKYFKSRHIKLNLPSISGGEKLYSELTGFKFDLSKKNII
jgi:hypothetical protein